MGEHSAEVGSWHRWKAVLGYGVAVVCLLWVFHGVRPREVFAAVPAMKWRWVGLAVIFDAASYLCQGKRWALLLRSRGSITTLKAAQAIYAALFINEILPLRVGEAARTWLVAKWLRSSFTTIFSSLLVERFFDSIWLALAIGLTVWFVPLPHYLMDAEWILAGLVFVSTGIFVYAVHRVRPSDAAETKGWRRYLAQLASGIAEIGRSRLLYASFGVSGIQLSFQLLSFWLVMRAYGLGLSPWHGAVVCLIVRLGTVIPTSPSNIGTYQFFTVAGLTLFGVDKTSATGFSFVVFLILTVPLWAIGIFAFARAGLSLKGVGSGKFEVGTP